MIYKTNINKHDSNYSMLNKIFKIIHFIKESKNIYFNNNKNTSIYRFNKKKFKSFTYLLTLLYILIINKINKPRKKSQKK